MIVSVILWAVLSQAGSTAVDLSEVQESLRSRGPKITLHSLFDDHLLWDTFLSEVGEGTDSWLEIAAALREVSDAHASETLDMAMQEALPNNPVGVLTLVAHGPFTVDGSCGMYGFGQIEDERPKSVIIELVDRRIDAVNKVTDSALDGVKGECLAALAQLREEVAK